MTSPQPGRMAAGRPEPAGRETAGQPASPGAGAQPPPGTKPPWKAENDGTLVFRLATQFVIWWVWVAFAIFNVFELVLRDRDYFSIEVIVALLAITGLAYGCAVRPKVTADGDGLWVRNPFRDHRVPWGAVKGIYLGDSVEIECARPIPDKDKTVYCWALYSGRRRRMRAQMQRSFFTLRPSTTVQTQAEAGTESRLSAVRLMATELGRRAREAKDQGAPEAFLESYWYWPALAALLLPCAALLGLILAR